MVLDIILIILFVLMMLYGYKKGCIGIVAKLVSVILALILAYFFAGSTGKYLSSTSFGKDLSTGVKATVLDVVNNSEDTTIISMLQEKLNIVDENKIVEMVENYAFTALGFVVVFIISRLVLWIAEKILENVFELPVLKTFNKLGGVITSAILFIIEISILLAIIKSIAALSILSGLVNIIQSSVITKAVYDHNIFTSLILSKII